MQHRDHPRQVSGGQIGPHHAGSLAALSKVPEGLVQPGRDVGRQGPGSARGRQQIVFARAQRYRRIEQLGQTRQGVSGAADGLDRRREVFGDALVQRRPNQLCLGRKPPVEGALTDPGATGDRLDGRVGPEFAVDLPRGFQDPLGVASGIRA